MNTSGSRHLVRSNSWRHHRRLWSLSPVLRLPLQKVLNCFHGIYLKPTGWRSLTSALQMPSADGIPAGEKLWYPGWRLLTADRAVVFQQHIIARFTWSAEYFPPSPGTFSFSRIINHPFLYVVYLQEEAPLLDGQLLSSILVETVAHQTVLQKWKMLCGSVCPLLFLVHVEPSCESPPNTGSSYSWITVEKQWDVMFDSIK